MQRKEGLSSGKVYTIGHVSPSAVLSINEMCMCIASTADCDEKRTNNHLRIDLLQLGSRRIT